MNSAARPAPASRVGFALGFGVKRRVGVGQVCRHPAVFRPHRRVQPDHMNQIICATSCAMNRSRFSCSSALSAST
ncbi:MAG: hypothetical protein U0521_17365 [Anaerolineae bacterium]